ncbi:hypothetical protein BGS_1072 [Beggiatoa sp. SS]|nr:hypothetical protein BGS_1072 [Beggiatoa sp. SS]
MGLGEYSPRSGWCLFIDLRDREGRVQVVFDPERADAFTIAETSA